MAKSKIVLEEALENLKSFLEFYGFNRQIELREFNKVVFPLGEDSYLKIELVRLGYLNSGVRLSYFNKGFKDPIIEAWLGRYPTGGYLSFRCNERIVGYNSLLTKNNTYNHEKVYTSLEINNLLSEIENIRKSLNRSEN
jgi:hypothetical protein